MCTGRTKIGLTTRGNLKLTSRAAPISSRNTGLVFHHHPLLSALSTVHVLHGTTLGSPVHRHRGCADASAESTPWLSVWIWIHQARSGPSVYRRTTEPWATHLCVNTQGKLAHASARSQSGLDHPTSDIWAIRYLRGVGLTRSGYLSGYPSWGCWGPAFRKGEVV